VFLQVWGRNGSWGLKTNEDHDVRKSSPKNERVGGLDMDEEGEEARVGVKMKDKKGGLGGGGNTSLDPKKKQQLGESRCGDKTFKTARVNV